MKDRMMFKFIHDTLNKLVIIIITDDEKEAVKQHDYINDRLTQDLINNLDGKTLGEVITFKRTNN